MRRLRLRPRMICAFSVVCALLVAVTAAGISGARRQAQLSTQATHLQELSRQSLELRSDATSLFSYVLSYVVNVPYATHASDVMADDGSRSGILALKPVTLSQLAAASDQNMTPSERALLKQVKSGLTAMFDSEAAGAAALKDNRVADAFQIFNDQLFAAYNQTTTNADKLVGMVTKRSYSELATATRSAAQTQSMMIAGCALAMVLAILLALIITRSITIPAGQVASAMRRLAERDLTAAPEVDGNDEMAEMSLAINQAVQAVRQSMTQVAERAKSFTVSANDLSALSIRLGENMQDAFERVGAVTLSADEVASNVNVMKSAAEQVSRASSEIARNGEEAVGVVDRGVRIVKAATETVGRVHGASIEIGKIVQTITGIAEQTNLLALNATIESARAGAAGKGFAIVAIQVKELALGTARATEDITVRIAAIQQATMEAIQAMTEVSNVVQDISGVQFAVASAVQEQSAMTNEIRRGISEIAENSQLIAGNVSGLRSTTGSSKIGANSAEQAARELATMAGELDEVVSTFRY